MTTIPTHPVPPAADAAQGRALETARRIEAMAKTEVAVIARACLAMGLPSPMRAIVLRAVAHEAMRVAAAVRRRG